MVLRSEIREMGGIIVAYGKGIGVRWCGGNYPGWPDSWGATIRDSQRVARAACMCSKNGQYSMSPASLSSPISDEYGIRLQTNGCTAPSRGPSFTV